MAANQLVTTPAVGNHARVRSRDWAVVLLVAATAGVSQTFGRFTYSLLLTDVRDDFELSNTAAGALGTVNLAAYLAGTIVVSMVVRRLGVSAVARIGIVASTTGIAVLAWSPGLAVLVIGQIVTGFGGAAVWVTAPVLAAERVEQARRGLAIGMASVGIGGAIVIASTIEASLPTEDWRTVYRVEAAAAVVITLLALRLLTGRPTVTSEASGLDALRAIPGWRGLLVAYSLYGLTVALFVNFIVASLEDDSGYSAIEAAAAFSAFGFGTIIGGPSFGPLSDRFGRRAALVAALGLMAGAAVVVPTGARPWATIAAFVFGVAFTGVPTTVAARIRDHVDGPGFGAAFGAATLGFGAALMIGPQLGGALGDAAGSFTPVFVLTAAVAAIAAGFAFVATPSSEPG